MKRTLALLTLAFAAAAWSAQTPDILGDWRGVLLVGTDEIHLTLHISAGDNGIWKATMDSAEQGARGVPVTAITFENSTLNFTIDSIHCTYTGSVKPDASAIEGTWNQGQPMPLNFTRPPKSTGTVKHSELEGVWQGTLQVGGKSLRFVFHVTSTADGLAATMDSPDQGQSGIPVISARREGDILTLQLPNLGAKYEGTIAKDVSAIEGAFTQGGASLPLTLKRGTDAKQPE
jgi:serine-type D-Ala-D-Ala carboxypeptidase/endopeptidase